MPSDTKDYMHRLMDKPELLEEHGVSPLGIAHELSNEIFIEVP